jgi:hypothetical protein
MIPKDFSCYVYQKDGTPVAWCHSVYAAAKLIHGQEDWTAERRGVVLYQTKFNDMPLEAVEELIQQRHDAIPAKGGKR